MSEQEPAAATDDGPRVVTFGGRLSHRMHHRTPPTTCCGLVDERAHVGNAFWPPCHNCETARASDTHSDLCEGP